MTRSYSEVVSLLKELVMPSEGEEGQRTYERRFGKPGVFLSLSVIKDIIKALKGSRE